MIKSEGAEAEGLSRGKKVEGRLVEGGRSEINEPTKARKFLDTL